MYEKWKEHRDAYSYVFWQPYYLRQSWFCKYEYIRQVPIGYFRYFYIKVDLVFCFTPFWLFT